MSAAPLTIRPVEDAADRKAFVDVAFELNKSDPNWVPPLKTEVHGLIDERTNPWFEHAEARFFIAERGGKPVGRISAQVDQEVLQHVGAGIGQWGMFEAADAEVAAELIARSGAKLEYVTPERMVAPDMGGMNYPAYIKAFTECGVKVTLFERLKGVKRQGNKLAAVLYNQYAKTTSERVVDQVVVEHGSLPADELYFQLKPLSRNLGEIDYAALSDVRPQTLVNNPDGSFQLFRIGDAVESRNIHAAVYDGLRLCLPF